MKKLIVLFAVAVSLVAINAQAATIIADWTFESTFASITGTSTTLTGITADTGTGTASSSHAAAATVWSSPAGNGSSHSYSSNDWSTGDFYEFQASTSGFSSISVSWDQVASTTGPGGFILQYSLDGSSFTTFGSQYTVTSVAFSSGTFNQALNYTRSNISTSLNNAANVYFRLVDNSSFGNNTALVTVPPPGTSRMDNFKILGIAPLANPTYWDVNGASSGLGGTGTWNTTTTNWNDSTGTGTAVAFDSSKAAIFSGTAGAQTVTVAGPGGVTPNGGIEFDVDGYTITGTTVNLGTTSSIVISNAADTGTINAPVAGSNGLTVSGNGTVVLGGTNTYAGQITISGATLSVANDSNLGDANNSITLDTGTLKATDNVAMGTNRTLDGNGTIDIASGKTVTVSGSLNTGATVLTNSGTLAATGGSPQMGGVDFKNGGTLRVGSTGTGSILMGGNVTNTGTSGTATVNGSLNFGSSPETISVTNANATIVITGNLTDAARVALSGAGTIDLRGDDSGLTNGVNTTQVGTQNAAGPTVKVHDANALGVSGAVFFNSGTIFNASGSPITFGSGLTQSLGSASSSANQFTNKYDGADMKFLGSVALFNNNNNDQRITVNNTTTFAGGWATSTGTTASPSVVINGSTSGHLVIAGAIDLDKPMAIETVTVDINGNMSNPAATMLVFDNATLRNGVDNALPTAGSVTVGSTFTGDTGGTYSLNGHNQTIGNVHLVEGAITGAGTLTSTSNYDVQNGTVSAQLAGSVGLVKTSQGVVQDGTVTLSGNNSYSGGTTVNNGTLIVAHVNGLGTGGLTINGTALTQLQAGLTAPVQLASLAVTGGTATGAAALDITNNNVIVHNGDFATLNAQVATGLYNGGNGLWSGPGINSSTANDDANNAGGDKAIGIISNDDGGGGAIYTSWPLGADSGSAVTVTNTDVLIKYTYFGDADMNGTVDSGADYSLWATGNSSGGTLGGWLFGDFDYSGSVDNGADYSLWATGFAASSTEGPLGVNVQPVPEPASLVLAALGLAGVGVVARARRRSKT